MPRPKRNTSKLNQNENCNQNTAAAKSPGEQLSDFLQKSKAYYDKSIQLPHDLEKGKAIYDKSCSEQKQFKAPTKENENTSKTTKKAPRTTYATKSNENNSKTSKNVPKAAKKNNKCF